MDRPTVISGQNMDYGVIGNGRSGALIGRTGSIDFCCLPDFDSDSVFAALLDPARGGRFAVEPIGNYSSKQEYLRRTNILTTTFFDGQNVFELIDFMPRYKTEANGYHYPSDIIRYVRVLSGRPMVRIMYEPRPNWAQNAVRSEMGPGFLKRCTSEGKYESVYLYSDLPLEEIDLGQPIVLTDEHFLLLSYNQKIRTPDVDFVRLEFERTKVYWMGWLTKTSVFSNYQPAVDRSALILKLLAFQKTGAILAAVTTSLPEAIGEVRNWDYRYCWLRDASMTISVLTRLGHYNVAKRFLQFILDIVPFKDDKIQIMYGIRGQRNLEEKKLDWLSGYEGSRPVRVGNAAYKQKQNDIYGVLMDAIYQSLSLFRQSLDNQEDLWTIVRTLTRHVRNNWKKLDSGIWEFRSERKHFTFSKILCWVAMDRAVKIAQIFGKQSDAVSYAQLRDRIKTNIYKYGIHGELRALTQFYGGSSLDAANLLADHYGFMAPQDPIYVNTVRETYKRLCVNGLMYRYRDADDFGQPHSAFTVCTFWMIRSLYRIGEKDLACKLFDELLESGNHLGLFSEDMDFKTRRLLGNFPQGYCHLALIDTAMTLSDQSKWHTLAESYRPD
ncbi:MAG: glycoside hydrolase family 15 protein [Sedimentisphaerales bacterium]|nr:glycoside hydrolase family 15 protein [Sedimentisphaerales bacterium]